MKNFLPNALRGPRDAWPRAFTDGSRLIVSGFYIIYMQKKIVSLVARSGIEPHWVTLFLDTPEG